MSGPKSSRYTLTPEQRRILEEQRRLERRKATALENIKRNNKKLLQIGSNLYNKKQIANELIKYTGDDGGFFEKENELNNLKSHISNFVAKRNTNDVNSLEEVSRNLANGLKKAEQLVQELSNISAHNTIVLQNNLNKSVDKGIVTSFNELKTEALESFVNYKNNISEQLINLLDNEYLTDKYKEQINNTLDILKSINQESFLKNYNSLTVVPLIKSCNKYIDEYERYHDEFEVLYNEYIALCNLYYYIVQDYICNEESIHKLKSVIDRIKKESSEDDEQAYISECLDEVMREMGYKIIGNREVVKKNGKRFRNELFTYGDGTAVNVTYSSDGRIAMELGGMDTTDRIPNDLETSILCDQMDSFCDDFKEIEKRLLEKGVVLAERISHLPSTSEFAQIINIEDYNMTSETNIFEAKRENHSVKKKKEIYKE